MVANRASQAIFRALLVGGAIYIASSVPAVSQVQSTQTVEHGPGTKTVKFESGVVEYVVGNDMVVKMENGELEHFTNVPDSITVAVDGKHLNIHQLKPGMRLERQTITTITPRVITTVETVSGKVWHVQPPHSVTITMENGQNQKFKIPDGQRFTVDGKETDAFGLRKGMRITVQRVTEVPETVMAQEVKRTGKMPPPPPEPKLDVPLLVAVGGPASPPPVESAESSESTAAEPAPTKLPKTASEFPSIGLLGLLSCGLSLMLKIMRVRRLP
jgi:hypothetical protein